MATMTARNELVASEKILTDNGELWVLSYFVQFFFNDDGDEYYGLRVEKSTPEGVLIESEETPGISECRDETFAVARAFAEGTVTPVTLIEMTDEWFSDHPAVLQAVSENS
ncbi:MAG: DUF6514 family protein [Defluviitaleaceae bacterium]|nr:DUF6514 family protein [Defluviitaleaceae bacterium]